MKKNDLGTLLESSSAKKLLITMKLTFFFILLGFLQVSASVYSQGTRFSFNFSETEVVDVLKEIEGKSEFRFFYQNEQIDVTRKVNISVSDKTLEDILDKLFHGYGITYKIFSDKLILLGLEDNEPLRGNNKIPQQKKLSGTVADSNGQPLPGVTVMVKGTTNGTVTNVDGGYALTDIPENATLTFSFVGMKSQEIAIGDQTKIDVTMRADAIGIEEVVAIGYGTQKRENVTGSVETAGEENLEGEPVVQVSQALQGDISGVSIRQLGGQPGAESSEIRIRGYGTFSDAGNDPLVLVDGIPSSMDNVNPNDIKNISVLKDAASAAIYGSRAANGVILIETKRGKAGVMEVSYSGYVGFSELADMPEFVDSWIYAEAYNEALTNVGSGISYTSEDIEKFKSGEFPDTHPNDHHYEMAFDNKALQTKHDIMLSGGSASNRYLFSLGYLRNDGILQNNRYDNYKDNLENYYNQYEIRLNVDSELKENLKLSVNLSGKAGDDHAPGAFTGDYTMERLVTRITRMSSAIPARTSEGWYGRVDRGCPWGAIDSDNHELNRDYYFFGKADITYNIIKPLTFILRSGYVFDFSNYRKYVAEMQVDETTLESPSKLTVNWANDRELTVEGLVKYDQKFGEHDIHALFGYSQTEHKYNFISAYRDDFPSDGLYELDVASSENQQNTGTASEWALVSCFSRLQYNYKGKYMLEANARYDGSSRFSSGNKFGLFPSFSVGWRISEENFVKESLPWVYNLKFRGSWGELGNQQIGVYPYQASLTSGSNYVYGDNISAGIALTTVANEDITWETTRIVDFGLDLSVLEGKMGLTVDYFNKTTRDILYSVTTAGVLGLDASAYNAGKVKNTGIDVGLKYKNSIGDFSYSFSPNFSLVKTEVLSLAEVEKDIDQGLFVGQPLNAIYGYVDDGLFVDDQDILDFPAQPYSPSPGDIKYKDISGPEGVPDGEVTADYDRKVIGQTSPKFNYGGQLAASYKSFDFSVTFYGAAGMRRNLENYAARAFANKSNVQQWMWNNRWTEENPNPNAKYPRFYIHGEGRTEGYSWYSTYWAWKASFLKIQSMQLGYNMPQKVTDVLKVQKMRIYLSGRNLFCFDNFYPGWDPETLVESAQGGRHYPMTRIFIVGLNVKF